MQLQSYAYRAESAIEKMLSGQVAVGIRRQLAQVLKER